MIRAGTMIRNSKSKSQGKMLPLVEEFFSIQGEGFQSGKAAWFIRLGGCDVGCNWCDTKFAWDPDIHPMVNTDLILKNALNSGADSVVITGGEPLMWNLDYLCSGFRKNNLSTFLETSGTFALSGNWDWICLSPKKNMPPGENICSIADELKVIIEKPEDFKWAEECCLRVSNNCRLFLQPEWSSFNSVIPAIVGYVLKNPQWRISLQIHKFMHIP
jgi:organic radical activating enzyme